MTDMNFRKEYNSSGKSIENLFGREEQGFFIPPYQREYTWEEENINQLFDDLVLGVRELSENDSAITFLGTTILTSLKDKTKTVEDGDERAEPTGVQIVIDGQQRISTLALIAIQITVKLRDLLERLPCEAPYSHLRKAVEKFIKKLRKLYAIELEKGADPRRKPKIIQARSDLWTYDGNDDVYNSPVARYIATYIRTRNADTALDAIVSESGVRVRSNIRLTNEWLKSICDAHIPGTLRYEQFPIGKSITSSQIIKNVLCSASDDVNDAVKAVTEKAEIDKERSDYSAAATYQLLLLTHYLLHRCGVNCLQPTHEEWGFDMFQALNATGTPLTAMETFLPQVMQAEAAENNDWDGTSSRESMDDVQRLFDATSTNEQKNRRTNELLGTFALCYEGRKLGNKFSEQRRYITQTYDKQLQKISEKREFVERLALTANFFYFGWYMEEATAPNHINGLDKHAEGEFASLLVRYLRDANSKLSTPILARFYSEAVNDNEFDEFIESAKACAAFFTLWRSANSTSGLDDIYRKYFKGAEVPVKIDGHNWKEHPERMTSSSLKRYFREILEDRGIAEKSAWITASERFLLYTELKTICRFILFIASHDRVADSANPGLTDDGTTASCTMLKLGRWLMDDHKSLEHVAPKNPPTGHKWAFNIYEKDLVHQVGNLILLPLDLNSLVDNKEWAVKYLHYCHVGKRSKKKLEDLNEKAKKKGVVLSKRATTRLSKAEYNCAVEPILTVGESGAWDAELIIKRTRQIKELAWEKLDSWLQP
ncbi:MAG: hypothetical protein M2R45_01420 [Verrucomicrobia subdivision 3 bacterium]|nr:hypothetical protein [Limisphaerales bacterium]MCS1415965.1 hypothetical protein [Limisphaerales bacterium]